MLHARCGECISTAGADGGVSGGVVGGGVLQGQKLVVRGWRCCGGVADGLVCCGARSIVVQSAGCGGRRGRGRRGRGSTGVPRLRRQLWKIEAFVSFHRQDQKIVDEVTLCHYSCSRGVS